MSLTFQPDPRSVKLSTMMNACVRSCDLYMVSTVVEQVDRTAKGGKGPGVPEYSVMEGK